MSFETVAGVGGASGKPAVYISSLVTEPELVEASSKLEISLREGNLRDFCQAKLATLGEDGDKAKLWQFIGSSFGENCDKQFIELLGFNLDELCSQLKALVEPMKENEVAPEEAPVDHTAYLGQLTRALLAGHIELAVDLAIKQNRFVFFVLVVF